MPIAKPGKLANGVVFKAMVGKTGRISGYFQKTVDEKAFS
jgi:hypothetical protein